MAHGVERSSALRGGSVSGLSTIRCPDSLRRPNERRSQGMASGKPARWHSGSAARSPAVQTANDRLRCRQLAT